MKKRQTSLEKFIKVLEVGDDCGYSTQRNVGTKPQTPKLL